MRHRELTEISDSRTRTPDPKETSEPYRDVWLSSYWDERAIRQLRQGSMIPGHILKITLRSVFRWRLLRCLAPVGEENSLKPMRVNGGHDESTGNGGDRPCLQASAF